MEFIIKKILDTKLQHLRGNCPEDITDLVFLEIEKSFISDYNAAVSYKDSETINQFIGKFIRKHWDLENAGRCNNPKSRLILSYEKHSNH
jgi:hypothetical protein